MTGMIGRALPRWIAASCAIAFIVTAGPLRAQDHSDDFAIRLSGIVNALDIFFSMPLHEWNREVVRLPNVARDDIFGSIERGLGVRFGAGGFTGTLEPDFETAAALSCLRITFETARPFSEDRLAAIEDDKIKPMMETLSLRYDSEYALESTDEGMMFTMFITRKGQPDCLIYNQAGLGSPFAFRNSGFQIFG